MDPRLGTDTSGPGEAVFAIRFNGKLGRSLLCLPPGGRTPPLQEEQFSLRSQVATYIVFHEESDSEVKNWQYLEPGGKK